MGVVCGEGVSPSPVREGSGEWALGSDPSREKGLVFDLKMMNFGVF